ncbi:MAG: hypothetical protein DRP87_09445 [Spirochaetes bacterium]|nr:MAG: hypothetical protein DRP87_09445 [Spirochaetota bacterium]
MEREESRGDDIIRFHYNREERMKRLSSEIKYGTRKGGILKGNRSLIILLLDVLLIIIIYVIINFFTGAERTPVVDGYSFSFRGFLFEEEANLSLKITRVEDFESTENELTDDNLVEVVFSAEGKNIEQRIVELLPERKGETRIVRGKLNIQTSDILIYADISFNNRNLRLSTTIKPE